MWGTTGPMDLNARNKYELKFFVTQTFLLTWRVKILRLSQSVSNDPIQSIDKHMVKLKEW